MVIVYIQGGLGNQLFQYAAASSLAAKLSTSVLLDCSWFELNKQTQREYALSKIFGDIPILSKTKQKTLHNPSVSWYNRLQKRFLFGRLHYYSDQEKSYSDEFFKLKGAVYLEGNFQSYNYHTYLPNNFFNFFYGYKGSFVFDKIDALIKQKPSISIHLRRGDYANVAQTNQIHGLLGIQEYKKAIKQMDTKGDMRYLIFSDDKEYALEAFKDVQNAIVLNEPQLSDLDELILMSRCNHNIIANSSFSWWAAYLNKHKDKQVVYPEKWFNQPPAGFRLNDLIPQNWYKFG